MVECYPIDGVVIYINDLAIWDKVGRHETTGNPLYAIAYKHPDFTSAFHTTVKSITWKVSKAGALKPVVNIETVDTGDCEMENPTGYNAAFIKTKQLAKRSGNSGYTLRRCDSENPFHHQTCCL